MISCRQTVITLLKNRTETFYPHIHTENHNLLQYSLNGFSTNEFRLLCSEYLPKPKPKRIR